MHHFVYWLFDPQTTELLYIGRSHEPTRRKRDFERLYQRKTQAGPSNRYLRIEDAQAHEIEMITLHKPPYNKRVTSSPTCFGMKRPPVSDETKAKLRAAKLGKKLTEEHKQNISQGGLGHKNFLGHKHSKETKAKMAAAHLLRLSNQLT